MFYIKWQRYLDMVGVVYVCVCALLPQAKWCRLNTGAAKNKQKILSFFLFFFFIFFLFAVAKSLSFCCFPHTLKQRVYMIDHDVSDFLLSRIFSWKLVPRNTRVASQQFSYIGLKKRLPQKKIRFVRKKQDGMIFFDSFR